MYQKWKPDDYSIGLDEFYQHEQNYEEKQVNQFATIKCKIRYSKIVEELSRLLNDDRPVEVELVCASGAPKTFSNKKKKVTRYMRFRY